MSIRIRGNTAIVSYNYHLASLQYELRLLVFRHKPLRHKNVGRIRFKNGKWNKP